MPDFVTSEQLDKYSNLLSILSTYGSVAVAFSSGVDSTFLLYAARAALDGNVLALTGASCTYPSRERNEAIEFCNRLKIRHKIIEVNELEIEGFSSNPKNRCYLCKKGLFSTFLKTAEQEGVSVVAEGSNLDDEGDYRPGLQAIAELGIKSPLREAGLTKDDIRGLSRHFGLPTWDKPSFACLASRFPYGETISDKKLDMVDKSEQLLSDLGFKQFRVRIHGDEDYIARIELLQDEMVKILEEETRSKVYDALKSFGFSYISIDLKGYRTGSMNEVIGK